MIIGIDASRAFIKQRTGIEEYSYQTIKNLRDKLNDHRVILYVRKNQTIDFALPDNWKIKVISWPYLWTQVGLSLEMLLHSVDTLFVPAHIVPLIHPKNTVVTIHGLEYEFCPEAYSFWERLYMRLSIKFSCRFAKKIISVSENTKQDLIKLYNIPAEKIKVVYEGYAENDKCQMTNDKSNLNDKISNVYTKYGILNTKYLLFVGRIETRKNVGGIINAFEILKEKYTIPHKLILVGKPGYGYAKIKFQISNFKFQNKIIELGYVKDTLKKQLLSNADVFIFPSLYEGFGLPVLEAQKAGVPVVASNSSSIPEVAGGGSALLVNPNNPAEIAEVIYKLISDQDLRKNMITRGQENVKRFSWATCGEEIARLLR